jgi:hypothetical protein
VLEFLTGSESFAAVAMIAAIFTFASVFAKRGSSRRINILQNENRRLKNMLADIMLEKSFAKDARS